MSLPVFYTPRMVADSRSFSPSAAKPAQVVARWRERGLAIDVHEPAPVTVGQLCYAHAREFVEGVLAGRLPNGFGNTSRKIAETLTYTSGAMLAAARHARAHGSNACAPVSGFHHATYRDANGFCTFNGLMVAACALLREDGATRVGILDYDMHYGDGTEDILDELDLHDRVAHVTAGALYNCRRDAERLLDELPERVHAMRGCDVVLYQAGADQHVDDPCGGVLTTEELRARDEIVFRELSALGIPLAWNLAGGYQKEADGGIPKVLEIHTNTALAALAVT